MKAKSPAKEKKLTRTLWVHKELKDHILNYGHIAEQNGWRLSISDKAQRADAYLCTESLAASLSILETCGVSPMVIFKPSATVPEFSLDVISESSILSLLKGLSDVCSKLDQLGDSLENTHHDSFYAGLVFLWSRGKVLDPLLDTKLPKAYGYLYFDTVIQVLNPRTALSGVDIFRYLEDSSLVVSTPFEVAHVCPKCESILLLLRDSCVSCGSPHVREDTLIHHFSCGHQAAEGNYLAVNQVMQNDYVCPKCRQPLRHFGVDYDKPGVIYHCENCFHDNGDTDVYMKCLSCQYTNKAEQSKKAQLNSYNLSQNGQKAVISGDGNLLSMATYIKEHSSFIPFDVFFLILKKVSILKEKNNYKILHVRSKDEISNIPAKKLLVEVGKALLRHSKETDSVSLYQGELFIMLLNEDVNLKEGLTDIKKTALSSEFSSESLNSLEFSLVKNDEFLSRNKDVLK